jgi:TonB-dependent SusC/RagA subfamily outer membrane receptor
MKKLITICLLLLIGEANAQDIFKETLYAADLVMDNREFISLTDQQAEKIKKIHGQNAADFRSLKWDLDNENKKLKNLLSVQKIDHAAVQKQMDLVLSLENQLKKKQLQTLVAIKNELTDSQQAELDILKFSPKSHTNLYGRAAKEPKQTSVQSFSNGSKNIVSVSTSSEGQPIFFVKQGSQEKKVLRVDNLDLDPNGIENISVLKGNSAWELYGEEGQNGVVIITLKKDASFKFN